MTTYPSSRPRPEDVVDSHHGHGAGAGTTAAMGRGARWIGAAQTGIQIFRVVTVLVLTQLLTPAEFGIVALVTVVTGFFERVIGDTGTSIAIVQRSELTQGLASSVFYLNIAVGVTTTAFFLAAADPIARLLGEPDALGFVRALGLLAVLNSLTYVPLGLFRRRLQFRSLAFVNLTNAVVTGLVSIAFALADHGAWAIVYGNLAGTVVGVVLAWSITSWRPSLYFSTSDLSTISSFSAYMSAGNLFGYVVYAGDRFVVGRLLGVTALGYYGLANRLMRYPTQIVAQTYRTTIFPGLARLQENVAATREAYRRSVGSIAYVLFPLCAVVAATAEPLVSFFLAPVWAPVAPVLAIVAVTSGLQAVAATTGSLFIARGRTDLKFRWQVASSIVYMICYVTGSIWGVTGVATGYLVGTLLLLYPAFAIPLGLIDVPVRPVLGEATVTGLAAAISGAAGYGVVRFLAEREVADLVQIASGGAVIALGYGFYTLLVRPEGFDDVMSVVNRRGRPVPAEPRGS